jgi:hypothetical protein
VTHRVEVQRRRGRRTKHELQAAPVIRDLRQRLVKLRLIILPNGHRLGALDHAHDAEQFRAVPTP